MNMWYLLNKDTDRPIKVVMEDEDIEVIGFATKKGLVKAIGGLVEDYEEVRKVEVVV